MSDTGQAIVGALTSAGWTVVVDRNGQYPRLQWRDEPGTVMVPLDPTAPEYGTLLGAALAKLGLIADRGASAQRALDELTDAGVIL